MKFSYGFIITFLSLMALLACENNDKKTISASATAYKNSSGDIVVRDATQDEQESIDAFYNKIDHIDKHYPGPPTPFKIETFAVKRITDNGIFILENDLKVKMSGIKCSSGGVHFLRKFFVEDTERLAFFEEKKSSNEVIDSYIWVVDSSMMNDPEMNGFALEPTYSGMNDTAILNNWCNIDFENPSKYHNRYVALEKISRKHNP